MVDGERVRWLRYDRGIAFFALARAAGISRSTLWSIEAGQRKTPRASVVARLAGALGVKARELLVGYYPGPPLPPAPPVELDTLAETEALLAKFKARWIAEAREEFAKEAG